MKLAVVANEFLDARVGRLGGFGWAAPAVAECFTTRPELGVEVLLISAHPPGEAANGAAPTRLHGCRLLHAPTRRVDVAHLLDPEEIDLLLTIDCPPRSRRTQRRSWPGSPTAAPSSRRTASSRCRCATSTCRPAAEPASQYAAVIPAFVAAARALRPPVIYGDGGQTRDFTFVDNAVHATLLAMRAPTARGEAINVACGEQTSISGLWSLIRTATGAPLDPRHEPGRASELRHSVADVSRAARQLGYRPIVRAEEGIRRLLAAEEPLGERDRASVSG